MALINNKRTGGAIEQSNYNSGGFITDSNVADTHHSYTEALPSWEILSGFLDIVVSSVMSIIGCNGQGCHEF